MTNDTADETEMKALFEAWRVLAIRWSLGWRERRMLLPAGGEDAAEPPADTETRMRILVEVDRALRVEDLDLAEWLRDASEPLNWHSPLEIMSASLGDLRRFRRFVEAGCAT